MTNSSRIILYRPLNRWWHSHPDNGLSSSKYYVISIPEHDLRMLTLQLLVCVCVAFWPSLQLLHFAANGTSTLESTRSQLAQWTETRKSLFAYTERDIPPNFQQWDTLFAMLPTYSDKQSTYYRSSRFRLPDSINQNKCFQSEQLFLFLVHNNSNMI